MLEVPTIDDVARAAGVSIATVSRVLSPGAIPHPVLAATAERVRAAARARDRCPADPPPGWTSDADDDGRSCMRLSQRNGRPPLRDCGVERHARRWLRAARGAAESAADARCDLCRHRSTGGRSHGP